MAEVLALPEQPVARAVKAGPDQMERKAVTVLAPVRLLLVVLVRTDRFHLSAQIPQEILVAVVVVTVLVRQTPALPFGDPPEELAAVVEAATTN